MPAAKALPGEEVPGEMRAGDDAAQPSGSRGKAG